MSKAQKVAGVGLAVASLAGIGAATASASTYTAGHPYHEHNAYGGGYSSKASCVSNYYGAENDVIRHGATIVSDAGGCRYVSSMHKWTYWGFDYYSRTYVAPGDWSMTYQQFHSAT